MVDANNVPVGFAPGCKLRDEVERQAAAPRQQRRRPCNKDVDPFLKLDRVDPRRACCGLHDRKISEKPAVPTS